MNLFGLDIDVPMTLVRAIHFAATAITAGTLTFRAVVAEPAFPSAQEAGVLVNAQVRLLARIGLAVAAVTGAIWLALQPAAMTAQTYGEAGRRGGCITRRHQA